MTYAARYAREVTMSSQQTYGATEIMASRDSADAEHPHAESDPSVCLPPPFNLKTLVGKFNNV